MDLEWLQRVSWITNCTFEVLGLICRNKASTSFSQSFLFFIGKKMHTTSSSYQYWCPLNPEGKPWPHPCPRCLACRSPQPCLPDPWLSCCWGLTHPADSPSALIFCPPCLFPPKVQAMIWSSISIKLTLVSPASWPHILIPHSLEVESFPLTAPLFLPVLPLPSGTRLPQVANDPWKNPFIQFLLLVFMLTNLRPISYNLTLISYYCGPWATGSRWPAWAGGLDTRAFYL